MTLLKHFLTVLTGLWLLATPAFALPLGDYQPHLASDEFYTEQWSSSVWAENGFYVHVQFVVSNIGLGDKKGAVKVEVTTPRMKRLATKIKVGDDWRFAKDRFALDFEGSVIEKRGDALYIKAGDGDLSTELTITSLTPGFNPAAGGHLYEKNGVYDMVLLAPRAAFKGVMTIKGKSLPIVGTGLVDHSWTTIPPHKLARRWLKFKFFSGDTTALFTGFATDQAGPQGLDRGWIWLGQKERTLFATLNPKVTFKGAVQDSKSKNKYKLPKMVTISSEKDGCKLEVTLRQKKLLRRKDVLDDLSKLESFVVARVSEPIDYTFNGDFQFTLTLPPVTEGGEAETIVIKENRDYVMQLINP